ncbi:MAG: hypothetical protein SW833_27950 [Cyanobacteriota bacterium]|nr:hypothetical protein [Cyanobacteriota bacterium]
MSQREGFASGFLSGALVGGIVGGIMGAVVASRQKTQIDEEEVFLDGTEGNAEANMEGARRSLENKIAQLNSAIDDVRQQLGSVNGSVAEREYSE